MKVDSLPTTQWKLYQGNQEVQDLFVREFGITPILSQILTSRHILTSKDAQKYLFPSLNDLHNPFLMKDMQIGVQRLIKAIYSREKVGIYGDYDADGITSVVILLKFLRNIGHDVTFYIPDRINEGYGLNKSAIDQLRDNGVKLIITVDCGISDHEQILYAKSTGMDVIILDHHEVPNTLPDAIAVINQNRKECKFPFKYLAAVGSFLIFLSLLEALYVKMGSGPTKLFLISESISIL